MRKQTVPVTMRALIQRINRKLAKQSQVLKKVRGERARFDLGDYFIINTDRNILMYKQTDPEALGRELGVLELWESVVQES